MKIKTWTDRITDESNLWLNAVKMDDANNYGDASVLYLNDALECLKHDQLIRAALSCLCAADCLAKSGYLQDSQHLFLEAAMIYEENSDTVIGKSVRESLWSLQEAYECFLLGSDYFRAQQVFDKYTSLTRRLNPFYGDKEAIEVLRQRKEAVESVAHHSGASNLKISNELHQAIEKLAEIRKPSKERHYASPQKNQGGYAQ